MEYASLASMKLLTALPALLDNFFRSIPVYLLVILVFMLLGLPVLSAPLTVRLAYQRCRVLAVRVEHIWILHHA